MDYIVAAASRDGLTIQEVMALTIAAEGVTNRRGVVLMQGEGDSIISTFVVESAFINGYQMIADEYNKFKKVTFFGVALYEKFNSDDLPEVIIEAKGKKIACLHTSRTYDPKNHFNGVVTAQVHNTLIYFSEDNPTNYHFIASASNNDEVHYTKISEGTKRIFCVGTTNWFAYKAILVLNVLCDNKYKVDSNYVLAHTNKEYILVDSDEKD